MKASCTCTTSLGNRTISYTKGRRKKTQDHLTIINQKISGVLKTNNKLLQLLILILVLHHKKVNPSSLSQSKYMASSLHLAAPQSKKSTMATLIND